MAAPGRKTKQQLIEEIESLRNKLDAYENTSPKIPAESQQIYETLAHNSQAGVYVILDGRFAFLNGKAALHGGYSVDELIGMKSIELVHP
jgi:PAS domain-containing protein